MKKRKIGTTERMKMMEKKMVKFKLAFEFNQISCKHIASSLISSTRI